MSLCPNQHESRANDFCDVCGVEMTPAAADAPPTVLTSGPPEICPACHAEHDTGVGDFCEVCGYNFKIGVPPATAEAVAPMVAPLAPAWELVVTVAADPHAAASDGALPPDRDEQVHALAADVCLIGRRSVRRQIYPDLSLDGDDGVSHRHARLAKLPDSGLSLEDLGSSNGTAINGVEVKPGIPVPLHEGDRIALGRWTVLVVRRRESPPSPPIL